MKNFDDNKSLNRKFYGFLLNLNELFVSRSKYFRYRDFQPLNDCTIRSWSLVPNKDWLIVRLCHDTPSQWPWRIYSFWVQFLSRNMWWLTFLRGQQGDTFQTKNIYSEPFDYFLWPNFSLLFSSLIIFI